MDIRPLSDKCFANIFPHSGFLFAFLIILFTAQFFLFSLSSIYLFFLLSLVPCLKNKQTKKPCLSQGYKDLLLFSKNFMDLAVTIYIYSP